MSESTRLQDASSTRYSPVSPPQQQQESLRRSSSHDERQASADYTSDGPRTSRSGSFTRKLPLLTRNNNASSAAAATKTKPSGFFSSGRAFQKQWFAFFVLGIVNNMGYVVVNSAAKSIADGFEKGSLIGAVVWANVAFGIGVRFLNTFCLLHTRVSARVMVGCAMLAVGCVGLALGTLISFWVCLVFVVAVGCFSSLGESVMLGFLREYDPALVGGWSSGTGMAGIMGTMSYLLMYSVIGMSNRVIFFVQAPFVVVYWLCYTYVNNSPRFVDPTAALAVAAGAGRGGGDREDSSMQQSGGVDDELVASMEGAQPDVAPIVVRMHTVGPSEGQEQQLHQSEQHSIASPSSGASAPARATQEQHASPNDHSEQTLLSHGSRKNNDARVSAAGRWDVDEDDADIGGGETPGPGAFGAHESLQMQEFYAQERTLDRTIRVAKAVASPALQLMDQVGVFFARSSVSIIQIQRIELLTAAQAFHFVLWFIHVTHPFLPLWLQLLDMMIVGLLGGAMYVNVFYLLMADKSLRQQDRELGINLTAIGINLGIVLSSVFELVLFSLTLKSKDD